MDILGRCPTRINESHRNDHIKISKHRETVKCSGGSNSIVTGSSKVSVEVQMTSRPVSFLVVVT